MSGVALRVRSDVLASLAIVLQGSETLSDLVKAVATHEACARVHDTTNSPGLNCRMRGTVAPVLVDGDAEPLRMLANTVRPGETLDGLVTALLIGEIRHRRTTLLPYVASADEPVMTSDDLEFEALLHRYNHQKEHTMFTIPLTVRDDVLAAFDASLAECEDRDETLALLIGAEAEIRREESYVACDGARDLCGFSMTTIDVEFDPDTHEELTELLRTSEEPGGLITALMIGSLHSQQRGPARADALLAVA